jgi:acetyl esterase/lipase
MPTLSIRSFLLWAFGALSLSSPAQTNPPAASSASVAAPGPFVVPDDVVVKTIVIGKAGAQDLHAQIGYPQNATKPLPAIINIHGGGWIGGSYKPNPFQTVFLAHSGYFTASIEYRLSNVAKWPAQLQDCKYAVRWLRANAAQYHVDPNRIGVWGQSAGGHLVACLATMTDPHYEGDSGYPGVSSAVQAVVDFYGPVDFIDKGINSPVANKLQEGLFGSTLAQNPDLWKSGSPLFYVKAGDPPVLIVHGGADGLVPLGQSVAFDQALTQAGVPHQFILLKNSGHAFSLIHGYELDPAFQDVTTAMLAFFDKYLKAP